MLYHIFQ